MPQWIDGGHACASARRRRPNRLARRGPRSSRARVAPLNLHVVVGASARCRPNVHVWAAPHVGTYTCYNRLFI